MKLAKLAKLTPESAPASEQTWHTYAPVRPSHRPIARRCMSCSWAARQPSSAARYEGIEHFRDEERNVFGRVEATLAPGELDAVGDGLQAGGADRQPPRA